MLEVLQTKLKKKELKLFTVETIEYATQKAAIEAKNKKVDKQKANNKTNWQKMGEWRNEG